MVDIYGHIVFFITLRIYKEVSHPLKEGVPDWGDVGTSYRRGVAKMLKYGIITGDSVGRITPKKGRLITNRPTANIFCLHAPLAFLICRIRKAYSLRWDMVL